MGDTGYRSSLAVEARELGGQTSWLTCICETQPLALTLLPRGPSLSASCDEVCLRGPYIPCTSVFPSSGGDFRDWTTLSISCLHIIWGPPPKLGTKPKRSIQTQFKCIGVVSPGNTTEGSVDKGDARQGEESRDRK